MTNSFEERHITYCDYGGSIKLALLMLNFKVLKMCESGGKLSFAYNWAMQQIKYAKLIPSLKAIISSASQEKSVFYGNSQVHWSFPKSPPGLQQLSEINLKVNKDS
jgi:hypothetical protein